MHALASKPPTRIKVAYLSNKFPSAVEPYVGEEIEELQSRGVHVTACSVWSSSEDKNVRSPDPLTIFTFQPWSWFEALALCVRRSTELQDFFASLVTPGRESLARRLRAFAHTLLGARLALLLCRQNVRHIHIHHGYLAAWIGMVAARLLRIPYSLTLHGSDLLIRPTFLDMKLQNCAACFTVSEFNRSYILERYPDVDPGKVRVQRMGVRIPPQPLSHRENRVSPLQRSFSILTVGRLHSVKDHAFLIRACAVLKASGNRVLCCIAGEGPERSRLQKMIRSLGLTSEIQLLGHVPRPMLPALYTAADLVILTSRSEGIPLTLMEAMALRGIVLAPAITGIPELILDGKTGFLYRPGSLSDFVSRIEHIQKTCGTHASIRAAAFTHVRTSFNLATTLQQFGDLFLHEISGERESRYADSLLQQV